MNNLGNFINRGLTFVQKFYDSKVPVAQIDGTMRTWCKEVNDLLKEYFECMEKNNQREGLRTILSISKLGNKLIQVWQPWVKVKSKVKNLQHFFLSLFSLLYNQLNYQTFLITTSNSSKLLKIFYQ